MYKISQVQNHGISSINLTISDSAKKCQIFKRNLKFESGFKDAIKLQLFHFLDLVTASGESLRSSQV